MCLVYLKKGYISSAYKYLFVSSKAPKCLISHIAHTSLYILLIIINQYQNDGVNEYQSVFGSINDSDSINLLTFIMTKGIKIDVKRSTECAELEFYNFSRDISFNKIYQLILQYELIILMSYFNLETLRRKNTFYFSINSCQRTSLLPLKSTQILILKCQYINNI